MTLIYRNKLSEKKQVISIEELREIYDFECSDSELRELLINKIEEIKKVILARCKNERQKPPNFHLDYKWAAHCSIPIEQKAFLSFCPLFIIRFPIPVLRAVAHHEISHYLNKEEFIQSGNAFENEADESAAKYSRKKECLAISKMFRALDTKLRDKLLFKLGLYHTDQRLPKLLIRHAYPYLNSWAKGFCYDFDTHLPSFVRSRYFSHIASKKHKNPSQVLKEVPSLADFGEKIRQKIKLSEILYPWLKEEIPIQASLLQRAFARHARRYHI